jgi:exodeoxyribonuclease V alpha subunit
MAAFEGAERARTQLNNAMYAELRPYGRAAHVGDPGERLTDVTAALADVERDLHTATSRVRAVANEPSIRTLPNCGLDSEQDRWAADRRARQQADARDARERLRLQQEKARRIEPTPPSRSTPDRSWGIGR